MSREPPSSSAASGIRSKNAAPIRIPAPIAMMIPTWLTARSATTPPRNADRNAAGRDEERGQRHAGRRSSAGGWQCRAEPEQLEAVIVDPVAGLAGDIADDRPQTGIVDLAGPAAARADDVVVVGRLAADVGVLAGRQIEAFDGAEPLEELEVRKTVARPTPG